MVLPVTTVMVNRSILHGMSSTTTLQTAHGNGNHWGNRMIDENKLYDMLEILKIYVGMDDDVSERLHGAINDVMANLDTNSNPELCQEGDDWVSWHGGEQPVPDGTPVEVRLRGGAVDSCEHSDDWYWGHNGDEYDVIAYRVIGYTPKPQPPAIPDGVPCWVTNRDGKRHLRVATGERDMYYLHGENTGWSESCVPGTMRPVCFESWDKVPSHVMTMELYYQHGLPTSRWLHEGYDPEPGSYYERRPR
jgi:hypothetical protein